MGTAGGVIQLVTRCASAEEFIERFARYTTATDVIVPALPNLTVGATGPFVICLNDRSIILKGRCEVTEIRRAPVAAGAALGARADAPAPARDGRAQRRDSSPLDGEASVRAQGAGPTGCHAFAAP